MERLAEIDRRIASLTELGDIMGAMRSLAAVHVQQAHSALPGIREYAAVMNTALADVISALPAGPRRSAIAPGGPAAVLVLTSEHGFVGGYNERLVERAAGELKSPSDGLLVIGSRGAVAAEERGCRVLWATPMATHLSGVIEVARRAAGEIYRRIGGGMVGRVDLVHAVGTGGGGFHLEAKMLLPFDPTPFRVTEQDRPPPIFYLRSGVLLEKLVDELVFAELMHATMESFAAENAARLVAMESAHQSIENKLDELQRRACHMRQEEITTELLDVVTGVEAAVTR